MGKSGLRPAGHWVTMKKVGKKEIEFLYLRMYNNT